MKDGFGTNIKLGDTVIYVTRRGSDATINRGLIVEAREDFVKVDVQESTSSYPKLPRTAHCRTPHNIVVT